MRQWGVVYVTLIDEVTAAGVQKDNNSICGSKGALQSLGTSTVQYIHVCVFLTD